MGSNQIPFWERPCAAAGLTSYRARGRFGWIMIGAVDHDDAAREARRSTDGAFELQVWDGVGYVPVVGVSGTKPA